MGEKVTNRVGEKWMTNEGYYVKIIEWFGVTNCSIQFEDQNILKNIQYRALKRGNVKNPYHPSICGVGYIGIGKYTPYKDKTPIRVYNRWRAMIQRCYSDNFQESHPTYIGCSVDEHWHNFQNFAEWYEEGYKQDYQLDKDILIKGNKIYSPETCCLVPREINMAFVNASKSRGTLPIGVTFDKCRNKYIVHIKIDKKFANMGRFNGVEEAFQAYKIAKEIEIKRLADKWKDQIDLIVYEAMYNYQVEVTD